MNILFITQVFPLPLDSGGKIKTYHTIRNLAAHHKVRVLTYIRSESERQMVSELADVCDGVTVVPLSRNKLRQASDLLLNLGLHRSFIIKRDYRPAMQNAYHAAVAKFRPDVVHIDHLQMAQFVDLRDSYKCVLDHHNIESLIVQRIGKSAGSSLVKLYAGVEWPKLRDYELNICRNCDMVLTVSHEDKATLLNMDRALTNVSCVPIGVDVEYFRPVFRDTGSKNILSVGTMYWPPNVDAMTYFSGEVFPLVLKQIPECTLTIAGQRPTASIKALAEHPSITVTGYVEDDRKLAKNCGVFIAPLRSGSGVRVKILNALAMGLPVVSTSVGAEGLEVRDGEHLLIADTARDFADAVIRVMNDRELAINLSENGRKLVCDKYSWSTVGERLIQVYRTVEGIR